MKLYDVIIFGATGFTGKWTVYEACSVLNGLRWGVAGRNPSKLQAMLKEMGMKANKDLSATEIVIADVGDQKSLAKMAEQCRIVVNCCGPYRFYGEPVVRACIEEGTHHVDVSGETQYMESMQLKYHKRAEEKGVYVVSACGFDSIPADMGLVYTEKNFDGTLNSVETYLKTYAKDKTKAKSMGGAQIHYGTWESAVHAIANLKEVAGIRSQLYTEKLPSFQPKLKTRPGISQSNVVKGVLVPFAGPDLAVVARSQRFFYETEKKRPVQMMAYLNLKSKLSALVLGLFATFFGFMTKFQLGRTILLKYPKLCSFGFVSHEGPAEESMQNSGFSMYFKGEGWPQSEKLSEPTDQFKTLPSKSIITKVSGINPGYGATCVALLTTAVTILNESDKMPGNGGVLPPGAAFAKTNLIAELEKHERGLKFEVLEKK